MIVQPVPLTDEAKSALDGSLGPIGWPEVEGWLADAVACVWRVGAEAWALTFVNECEEVEIIAAGGRGAWAAVPPFEKHMRELPEHEGMTLRVEGRKGWARLLPHWECENMADGSVLLKLKV